MSTAQFGSKQQSRFHSSESKALRRAVRQSSQFVEYLEARQLLTTAVPNVSPAVSSTGTITGNLAPAAASYNLTTLGISDWAAWGRGGSAGNFDHDATGGSQISNVTKLGPGTYGAFSTPRSKRPVGPTALHHQRLQ